MNEYAFVALSFALGLFSAAVYAVFKVLRLNFSPNALRTFVLDLIFVLFSFGALFLAVLYAENGIFRLYMFFSAFAGFLLFRMLFNRYLYPKTEKLIARLYKIIKTAKDKIVDKNSADKKSAGEIKPAKK